MYMENQGAVGLPQNLVKTFPKYDMKKTWPYLLVALLVVLAGVGTGSFLSKMLFGSGGSQKVAPGAVSTNNEAGKLDPNFKYDNAEGVLKRGGIGDEGTHHLEREGGPTKTVYLTSSVIDLESFVDKKVQVWGETQAGKKAGWLMDVAKVKVVE